MIAQSIKKKSLKLKNSKNKEKSDRKGRGHVDPCFNFLGIFLTKSFREQRDNNGWVEALNQRFYKPLNQKRL